MSGYQNLEHNDSAEIEKNIKMVWCFNCLDLSVSDPLAAHLDVT